MITDPYEVRDSQVKAFASAERRARARLLKKENTFVTVQYELEDLRDFIPDVDFEISDRKKTVDVPGIKAVMLGAEERSLADVMHQLAHLHTPREYARHGPEFIQNLLGLIENYAGPAVSEIYFEELESQKMLRFTPSYKPALAFLNYAKNHKGVGRQIVIVYEDKNGKARKVVGEYCGMDVQRKTGVRVAVVRMFGQVSDREIPVKQLRYTFWPRTDRK